MKKIFTLVSIFFAIFGNINSSPSHSTCWPDFNFYIINQDSSTITFQFQDSSWNSGEPYSLLWNFGDGLMDSTQNPQHTFMQGAFYSVCISLFDSSGNFCDSICKTVPDINQPPVCSGSFWYSQQTFSFAFTDYSQNASSWSWDFGDGSTSSLQNPVHTYSSEGNYNVCLTITDTGTCTDNYCVGLWAGCFYDTTFYYNANGTTVQFYQYIYDSLNSNFIFSWDFGDGNFSSTPNPSYTYTAAGTYDVCLFVQDTSGLCADTFCKTITVNCLNANFYYGNSNQVKYAIDFFNYSSPGATGWLWEFGDGSTDTIPNPIHTYQNYGSYNVCLTITNPDSCIDTYCQYIYVQCCELDFRSTQTGTLVSFITDTLICGWFNSYNWYFGDGINANQNYWDTTITHVYLNPGTYTVCLASGLDSANYGCIDSICKNIVVPEGDTCAQLVADIGGLGIRPQIATDLVVHYCNFGSWTADSTTITINFDPQIIVNSASPAWFSQSANTYTWIFSSLPTGQCGDIYINVQGTAGIPVGSVVCADLEMTTTTDDCDFSDFTKVECFNVVNSFDPNDKRIASKKFTEKGYIFTDTVSSTDALNYMIRFQNTGTASAVNIFVYDSLDSKLNPSSVIPGASSHTYDYFEIIGNVLKWSFLGINLADSANNEPASHGFVKFTIQQAAGNLPGTSFPNRSGIVFDFNSPVITNDAIAIVETLKVAVEQPLKDEFLLSFPNPVKDELLLILPEKFVAEKCEITDLTGRLVYLREGKTLSGTENKFHLSLGYLSPGMYALSLTGQDGTTINSNIIKQ